MNLFEKVGEVKECNEKANRLAKELKANLLKQFVELPYEIKKVEANYERTYSEDRDVIAVYYPILNTPEGYKKEEEKFYREYLNCINHEYTLIDEEGRKVTIWEQAIFERLVYYSRKAYMNLKFYIAQSIEFKIEILGETYSFKKRLKKELIKEVIGKNDVLTYNDGNEYDIQEKKYNKFLKLLDSTKNVPTLRELSIAHETEIQITDSISAIVEAKVIEGTRDIWLENNMYSVRIEDMPTYSVTIKIKPYFNKTIELAEQRFDYEELENEAELREGKTFDEIVEILESYQIKER